MSDLQISYWHLFASISWSLPSAADVRRSGKVKAEFHPTCWGHTIIPLTVLEKTDLKKVINLFIFVFQSQTITNIVSPPWVSTVSAAGLSLLHHETNS